MRSIQHAFHTEKRKIFGRRKHYWSFWKSKSSFFFEREEKNLNCSSLSRFFQRPSRAKHNTIDLETKLSFRIRPRSSPSVSSASVRSLKTRSLGFPTLDSSVFRAVFYSQLVVTLPKFTRALSRNFSPNMVSRLSRFAF
jgi:hypothetical protein